MDTKPQVEQKKPETGGGNKITISITDGIPGDEHPHVSKKGPDLIRWRSADKQYNLTFNQPPSPDTNPWPFEGPVENPIVVPAGGYTKWYKIRQDAVDNAEAQDHTRIGYGYGIDIPPPPPAPRPIPELIPDP